jgi:hypothetical protein
LRPSVVGAVAEQQNGPYDVLDGGGERVAAQLIAGREGSPALRSMGYGEAVG